MKLIHVLILLWWKIRKNRWFIFTFFFLWGLREGWKGVYRDVCLYSILIFEHCIIFYEERSWRFGLFDHLLQLCELLRFKLFEITYSIVVFFVVLLLIYLPQGDRKKMLLRQTIKQHLEGRIQFANFPFINGAAFIGKPCLTKKRDKTKQNPKVEI